MFRRAASLWILCGLVSVDVVGLVQCFHQLVEKVFVYFLSKSVYKHVGRPHFLLILEDMPDRMSEDMPVR